MSARQRARLQQQSILESSSDEEEEEVYRQRNEKKQQFVFDDTDEDDEDDAASEGMEEFRVETNKKSTFVELADSSSSGDESEVAELQGNVYADTVQSKSKSTQDKNNNSDLAATNVDEFLDEFVRRNKLLQAERDALFGDGEKPGMVQFGVSESILHESIDPKQLNWDQVIRNRFGGEDMVPQNNRNWQNLGRNRPNNQRNNPNKFFANKRWLFGQPDEDWVKPPSFIGGGMGMNRLHTEHVSPGSSNVLFNLYTFQWSKEYQKLTELYRIAKSTGDVNYLIMFLANYPYFAEGFLDLSYIFCQMGMMERGLQCLRRVLFLYECASMEAFRPHLGQSRLLLPPATLSKSLLRKFQSSNANANDSDSEEDEDEDGNSPELDACIMPNQIYLRALWRFMQLVEMQGHPHHAANIAKIILALNPTDDEVQLLLSMDYYLLQAGQYEFVAKMGGMHIPIEFDAADDDSSDSSGDEGGHGDAKSVRRRKDDKANDSESPDSVVAHRLRHHWQYAYAIDRCLISSKTNGSSQESCELKNGIEIQYTLEHMPNWWYSLPLAFYLSSLERAAASQHTGNPVDDQLISDSDKIQSLLWSRQSADYLLQQAFRRWPMLAWELFMRNYLEQDTFSASGVHVGKLYQRLQQLSSFFVSADASTIAGYKSSGGNLVPSLTSFESHIIKCYLIRCAKSTYLWARREVWSWFVANLEKFVTQLEEIQKEENRNKVMERIQVMIRDYIEDDSFVKNSEMPVLEGEEIETCPMMKYCRAEEVDFEAEIPRLRMEGVPLIEEHLLDERVLAGNGVKFKKLDKHLMSLKDHLQMRRHYHRWVASQDQQSSARGGIFGYVLDLSMPLLQLFFMSLLPWMVLPPVPRHLRPQQLR